MSILITGGCGFIGSHCAHKFVSEGFEVICFDLKIRRDRLPDSKVTFIQGDILDMDRLLKIVDEEGVTGIVHTAAFLLEANCRKNPKAAFHVNVVGTFNVVEIAKMRSIKLINISSQAVYGNLHEGDLSPISEDEPPPPPRGIYSAHKLMGELLVTSYRNVFGVDAISLRTNWVYGPLQETIENPISIILKKAIKGEPFVLDHGGDHPLSYTYVKDLANAVFLAYEKDGIKSSALNIDSGQFVKVRDVARIIKELYPKAEMRIGPGLWPELIGQTPLRGPGDLSKAREELGYVPKWPIEVGIREYAQWLEGQL